MKKFWSECENCPPSPALFVTGDFNSTPDSEVYDFMRKSLGSGYKSVLGKEPDFTNFTEGFIGTLDYLFYDEKHASAEGVLNVVNEEVARADSYLPSLAFSSDHCSLLAEFRLL